MSYTERETVILVPAELARSNKSIGIDIGSSCAKFVYFVEDDVEDDNTKDSKTFALKKLRIVTFKRDDLMEGLRYVKQRAHILDNETDNGTGRTTINVTGLGCSQMEKEISDSLNMRFRVRSEMDGLVTAFSYLASKLPRRFFVESQDEQVVTEAIRYSVKMADIMANMSESAKFQTASNSNQQQFYKILQKKTGYAPNGVTNGMENTPLCGSGAGFYPILLTSCGSVTFSMKVTAPGVYLYDDLSPSGGRTMLGIANILVGVKTYEEFITLASKGNSFKVHGTFADITFSENANIQDNIYKDLGDSKDSTDVELYSFGKLVGSNCDDFKREDIASAGLDCFVQDFVRNTRLACYKNGLNRVFICGGVLSHPHVRRLIAKEMIKNNLVDFLRCQARPVEFDFITVPQHLTALSCLVFDEQEVSAAKRV